MNLPNDPNKKELPEEAKGNPVYEQTRQDMPLFCCGRNCGRNSRIVVLILALIGIGCSAWFCLSANYFTFISLRNDTFYDEDKLQPDPFKYATEAWVGVFRYEILEVYEYPWPPPKQERYLAEDNYGTSGLSAFESALLEEMRKLQDEGNNGTDTDDTSDPEDNITTNVTDVNATFSPTTSPTWLPTQMPTTTAPTTTAPPIIPIGAGSDELSSEPTTSPTPAPTITNPNDIVYEETHPINTVKKYELGLKQFEGDSVMTNGQRGALFAPIFAGLGVIFCCIELFCCIYKCSWLPTALFLYLAFMFQTFTLFMFLSEEFCKYAQDCQLGYAGYFTIIAIVCYMIAQSLICCSPRPQPMFNCCKKAPVRRKKKKKKKKHDEDELDYNEGQGLRDYDYEDDGGDGFEDEPDNRNDYYDDGDGYVDPYAEEDEYTNFEDNSYYGNNNARDRGSGSGSGPSQSSVSRSSDDPDATVNDSDIYSTNQSYRNNSDGYDDDDGTYGQEGDETSYDQGSSAYSTNEDGETSYYTDDQYTDGDYYTEDDETNGDYASQYTDNDYTSTSGDGGGGGRNNSGRYTNEENDSGWSTGEENSQYT